MESKEGYEFHFLNRPKGFQSNKKMTFSSCQPAPKVRRVERRLKRYKLNRASEPLPKELCDHCNHNHRMVSTKLNLI